jgi:hypothetical protein
MKGLCHECMSSNVELNLYKGTPKCNVCFNNGRCEDESIK